MKPRTYNVKPQVIRRNRLRSYNPTIWEFTEQELKTIQEEKKEEIKNNFCMIL